MKYKNAASALAVSMIAAGAAAGAVSPAVASGDSVSLSTQGVKQLAGNLSAQPLNSPVANPLLHTATGTAQNVNQAKAKPVKGKSAKGKPAKPVKGTVGASKAVPMVGGLPIGR
ncbi:hypothetical protein J7I98_38660 [Streptomyces sp. ISL-98]|uniref:hypothetical protein n=1 Tax=Streptomyces sp. ISL-98 TaxID=2819192 RepID=UPI001BE86248|nr:hypothetical protein [Streptomyces sp. ISL-98]MBT2511602.1 hypothetical protein [Streptomyces sp. ISL-98]